MIRILSKTKQSSKKAAPAALPFYFILNGLSMLSSSHIQAIHLQTIIAAIINMTARRALPCFSFGSRSCHQSVSLFTRLANPSMAPVSKEHRVRTYSRYTAIGSITVFNPIADSCFPNTDDMPMPLPMTMMLTLSANNTHLRSSKSSAVHIPTTIRNITGRKSCKIGTIARFNVNDC